MNNLTELQTELRRLSRELEGLVAQVEGLKEQEDHEAEDFAALEELARRDPLNNPALKSLSEQNRERYLRLLSTAAGLDGNLTPEQLLYLCRAAAGVGEDVAAQRLYGMAYQTDRLEWQASAAGLREVRRPLLLDMLMLANMNGPASDRAMEFIAEVAGLLGCDQEEAEVVSKLSAALLAMDFEMFRRIRLVKPGFDLAYLVPLEWIENDRTYCGSYTKKKKHTKSMTSVFGMGKREYDFGTTTAIKQYSDGRFVIKRTELVKFSFEFEDTEFEEMFGNEKPKISPILAPKSGFVYYVPCNDGYIDIWIAGAFDSGENFPMIDHLNK